MGGGGNPFPRTHSWKDLLTKTKPSSYKYLIPFVVGLLPMTLCAYNDPSTQVYSTIITTTAANGYWLDGVWYPSQTATYPSTYPPEPWYQPIYPLMDPPLTLQPYQPLQPLKVPDMSPEAIQKLIEALQGSQFNPPPAPAQETAPAPKEEPAPAQDLTRPFERKLDLD